MFCTSSGEYKSLSPLKIGKEIKIIATMDHHSQIMMLKWLDLHGLNNVQVILLDDLYKIKREKRKLSNDYHHSDGVPTLKWLAAKKFVSSDESFNLVMQDEISPMVFSSREILAQLLCIMRYQRMRITGGCYFFTVNLAERKRTLSIAKSAQKAR